MSVFLAIDVDEPVRAALATLIETHRGTHEAKWLKPEKLHLTLVFLGNPDAEAVARVTACLPALAARHAPFTLHLRGAGTFVTQRAPAVLWLGVAGALEPLFALQADAARTLVTPDKPFVPHVTLARSQTPRGFDALAAQLGPHRTADFEVRGLTLYESTHHRFHALAHQPFAPGA